MNIKLDSANSYNISEYALSNPDNYNINISNNVNEILDKYVLLLLEYMSFITENISIKNEIYYKFIFLRGVDTISHVFNFILMYTKNLDLAYYHSQKAFYFYVEFIIQITDDQHSFLQLSSRDAIMFVYKRTIFEIGNDQRKNLHKITKDTTNKIDILQNYMTIFKVIISFLFNNDEYKFDMKHVFIKKQTKYFLSICSKLNTCNFNVSKLGLIITFIKSLNDYPIDISMYFELIQLFIKKNEKSTNEKGTNEKSNKNNINDKNILVDSNVRKNIFMDEVRVMILSNEDPVNIIKLIFSK